MTKEKFDSQLPDGFDPEELLSMKDELLEHIDQSSQEEKETLRTLISEIEKIDSLDPKQIIQQEVDRLDKERATELKQSLQHMQTVLKGVHMPEGESIAQEKIGRLSEIVSSYEENIEEAEAFERFKRKPREEQKDILRTMHPGPEQEKYRVHLVEEGKRTSIAEMHDLSKHMKEDWPAIGGIVEAAWA